MTRREEIIAKVRPFCVKGDRLSKMMMIAADGVDFPTARQQVKGLDPSTYHCLMVLGGHREADAPQSREEISARQRMQKQAVFAMIAAGASFEEMCSETMLGRETVGHYVSRYAQEKGVDREDLPCVVEMKRQAAEKAKFQNMKRRICAQEKRKQHAPRVRLRQARIRKGLKSEDMGKLLGIAKEHYSKLERGEHRVGEAYIPLLRDLLGIDREEILEQVQMSAADYAEYLKSVRLQR